MTEDEAHHFILDHDAAYARQLSESGRLLAMRPSLVGGANRPHATISESDVTASGTPAGTTMTALNPVSTMGTSLASWSSETQVTSGIARRVHLTTQGTYSQIQIGAIAKSKQFSDVCGDGLLDLFKQHCSLGTIYTDVDCYTVNGSIFASSQHAVDWLTSSTPPWSTSHQSKCFDNPKPPVAALTVDADGETGVAIAVTIPSGDDVSVGLDGSGSTEGDFGIASYAWTANGSPAGSGSSASVTVSNSTSFSLKVTDRTGVSAYAGGSISISFECMDPAAENYGDAGDCTYAPDLCEDPDATNYLQPGDCDYPPPPPDICEDPAADNYGAVGACDYPPPVTCDDPSADNFGAYGDCTYSDPPPTDPGDPGAGDGGGGGWDDPCSYEIEYDPWCDDGGGYEMSVGRNRPGASGIRTLGVRKRLNATDPNAYYVVLADRWADPTVLSVVGRFKHKQGYVDAIFLPASNPTALGYMLAERALKTDRKVGTARGQQRRIIKIGASGTQTFLRRNGKPLELAHWKPIPQSSVGKEESNFHSGLLKKVLRVAKKPSKHLQAVRLIKWPRQ